LIGGAGPNLPEWCVASQNVSIDAGDYTFDYSGYYKFGFPYWEKDPNFISYWRPGQVQFGLWVDGVQVKSIGFTAPASKISAEPEYTPFTMSWTGNVRSTVGISIGLYGGHYNPIGGSPTLYLTAADAFDLEANPVPEPSSTLVLLPGLAVLAARCRKCKA
jgi:hypothetical protein